MKSPVVHFEIYGDDPERLAEFYRGLFGWTIETADDYRMIKTAETDAQGRPRVGINGGLMKRPSPEARGWLNYISVESVDGALERAQKLGASVMKGKSAVPSMGWFALLVDPQGNPFGLWQDDPKAE